MTPAIIAFVLIVGAFILGRLTGITTGVDIAMSAYTVMINRALKDEPEAKRLIARQMRMLADGRLKAKDLV